MDLDRPLTSEIDEQPSVLSGKVLVKFQDVVTMAMMWLRRRASQGFVVFSFLFLLLWLATFLYGSFYYSYMPKATFSTPVHYYYRCVYNIWSAVCVWVLCFSFVICVLTFGQAYQITLQLEMPDSPTNQELGMFMIKTTCFSQDGGQVASSSRSGMLRYQSELLRALGTMLFLPAFLSSVAEEKQMVEVELFSEYTDDPYSPSTTAVVEILSKKIQIYSAQLQIHAHFTGLRYLLFYFPVTSTLVGVSSNFIFLSILFLLSYTRLLLGVDQNPQPVRSRSQPPSALVLTTS
uniref:Seipin n=1 Tax=Gouania willdenowi TaxID=441366 RepID=A0A8C5E2R1_GOUWI